MGIGRLPLSSTDPWTSILLSGSLAIVDPNQAYTRINQMNPGHFDDGLTKVWALYWASSQRSRGSVAPLPSPSPTPAPGGGGGGCCKWGGNCGDCGNDGSGWCHQSSSNCAACAGMFDGSASSPTCR